ncbi:MAG: hypothetical protein CM1200mP17_14890 [Woeseia sp.]|nr:MAG: hypothetical protein CM1200mP17_14890 [Woeseia sp.]
MKSELSEGARSTFRACGSSSLPRPGLGVRILGEVKKEYADLLRSADAIFMKNLLLMIFIQGQSGIFSFSPSQISGRYGRWQKI